MAPITVRVVSGAGGWSSFRQAMFSSWINAPGPIALTVVRPPSFMLISTCTLPDLGSASDIRKMVARIVLATPGPGFSPSPASLEKSKKILRDVG